MEERLVIPTKSRLLVFGDCMLDRYVWGDTERVSPEAPVLVLQADGVDLRPGGAASVACLARGFDLDVDVTLCGVVGNDKAGRELRTGIAAAEIDDSLLFTEDSRPTTMKERFLGRVGGRSPHQLLRVDYECREELSDEWRERLIEGVADRIDQFDAILISDYAKGVCTEQASERLIHLAQRQGIPLLVDPGRRNDFSRFRGATLLKANRSEVEQVLGTRCTGIESFMRAGESIRANLIAESVVVTLDRDGMVLCTSEGSRHLPARARDVCDITGAGDMVLSALGVCLAGGFGLQEAVQVANTAAGLEVELVGISPIRWSAIASSMRSGTGERPHKIINRAELQQFVERQRAAGRRIVFTNGCFDLLHAGHVQCLEESARLGDVLIVGVNSDASVQQVKGPDRPVICQSGRASVLAALGCVDAVVVFDEETPIPLLQEIRPDVLAKGAEYGAGAVVGEEVVRSYGGRVETVPMRGGFSTTRIVDTIRNGSDSVVGEEVVHSYGGRVCTVPMREGISTTRIVNTIRSARDSVPGR